MAYVDSLYANVLQRAPDAAGEAFWVGEINSGVSRQAVMRAFENSTELGGSGSTDPVEFVVLGPGPRRADQLANQAYVDSLYTSILGRDAEAAGETFWTDVLDSGVSRSTVRSAFINSPEHQQQLADQQSSGTTGSTTGPDTTTGNGTSTDGTSTGPTSTGQMRLDLEQRQHDEQRFHHERLHDDEQRQHHDQRAGHHERAGDLNRDGPARAVRPTPRRVPPAPSSARLPQARA